MVSFFRSRSFDRLGAVFLLLAVPPTLDAQVQFQEAFLRYVLPERDWSETLAVADVDGDGDPDVLIGCSGVIHGVQDRLLLNQGGGTFVDVTATHLPRGAFRTAGIAFGDVDGDGDLDFVTANIYQNRLYLNDGTGRFQDATFGRMPVDRMDSRKCVLADFDGDGDLDLVFANYRQEFLYLNDGTGTFTDVTATHLPVNAISTWDVAAADVDGDGDLDLAFAEQNRHSLWLNDGNGVFTDVSATRLPSPSIQGASLRFLDVDGDGDVDLVAGNWNGPPTQYRNDGTGTFTDTSAAMASILPRWSWTMDAGDIDGDGDVDLVFSCFETENRIVVNDGSGGFTDQTATRMPRHLAATVGVGFVDVDRDGDLDLMSAERGAPTKLWFNDGSGRFLDATRKNLDGVFFIPRAVELADLNGDGVLDLVFAAGNAEYSNWQNRLQFGDGRGAFRDVTSTHFPADSDESLGIAIGDVDGDGDLDVVFGNDGSQNKLYRNDGIGAFTHDPNALPADADPTWGVALGDVDGDGDLDLVCANLLAPCRLYRNDGAGVFTDVSNQLPVPVAETRDVVLADLNGDGHLDVVFANGLITNQRNGLWLGDGTGHFQDASSAFPNEAVPTSSVAVGDVDGDGDLDLWFGNDELFFGTTNSLYVNDGAGGFGWDWPVYDLFRTFDVAMADMDDDGDLDLLCADQNHFNKLYLNDGSGGFHDGTDVRMPQRFEGTTCLAAGDVDGDGDVDLVCGNDGPVIGESILYLNHHRQLAPRHLAELGTSYALDVHSRAGYANGPQLAFLLFGVAPTALSLPPYGTLGVDLGGLVVLPFPSLVAPAGRATLTLPVPGDPGLAGLAVYFQGFVAPTANPLDARFTNVVADRLVSF